MSEHSPQNEMAPEDVVAWLNGRFNGTLMGQIGIKMLEVGPERAIAEMEALPDVMTMTGHIHAGAMISLADSTATFAAVAFIKSSYVDLDRFPVAIGISSYIVSNTQHGAIHAESTVSLVGRTLVTVDTRVTTDEGRLLAIVTSTHFVRNSSTKAVAPKR